MDLYGHIEAKLLEVDRALVNYGEAKDRVDWLTLCAGVALGLLLAAIAVTCTWVVFALERV